MPDTHDPFANLPDEHRVRVEALLRLPEAARKALWSLSVPGWSYWIEWPEKGPREWTRDPLNVGPSGTALWVVKEFGHSEDVCFCPYASTDVLKLAAETVGGSWTVHYGTGNGQTEIDFTRYENSTSDFYALNDDPLLAALDVLRQVWEWKAAQP